MSEGTLSYFEKALPRPRGLRGQIGVVEATINVSKVSKAEGRRRSSSSDADDALRAVKLLQPRLVMPMHYDTFEVIQQDVSAWAERVTVETDAEVVLLAPGDSYILE